MLTRDQMRALWEGSGLSYGDIRRVDISRLESYLGDALDGNFLETGLSMWVRFGKSIVGHAPDGSIECAFVRIADPGSVDLEGVSFNRDGFIGFAGWASDENVQPVLRAFKRWLTRWMPGRTRKAVLGIRW